MAIGAIPTTPISAVTKRGASGNWCQSHAEHTAHRSTLEAARSGRRASQPSTGAIALSASSSGVK